MVCTCHLKGNLERLGAKGEEGKRNRKEEKRERIGREDENERALSN